MTELYVHTRAVLVVNALKCRGCGKVVRSWHRHDFRGHKCKTDPRIDFFVDGGTDYQRYGWGNDLPCAAQFEDFCKWVYPAVYTGAPLLQGLA